MLRTPIGLKQKNRFNCMERMAGVTVHGFSSAQVKGKSLSVGLHRNRCLYFDVIGRFMNQDSIDKNIINR